MVSSPEVRDVLVRALDLLGPEGEHWTKGAFFRDARGDACFGNDAVCRCPDAALAAAAWAVGDWRLYQEAATALAKAWHLNLDDDWPVRELIIDANDADHTTFPHVRSAFQRAIASLSEPEGTP